MNKGLLLLLLLLDVPMVWKIMLFMIYTNFKIAVATWATNDSNLVAQPNFWGPSIN